MSSLAAQRCFNHAGREAAVRCTDCRQYFCRECTTDHEGRAVCATCLVKRVQTPRRPHSVGRRIALLVLAIMALLAGWFFFHLIGEALVAIPASLHEGTIWENLGNE